MPHGHQNSPHDCQAVQKKHENVLPATHANGWKTYLLLVPAFALHARGKVNPGTYNLEPL